MSQEKHCQSCGAQLVSTSPRCQYCGADNPYYRAPAPPRETQIFSPLPDPEPAPVEVPSLYAYSGTFGRAVIIMLGIMSVFFFVVISSRRNATWWYYAAGGDQLGAELALSILIVGPLSTCWTLYSLVPAGKPFRPLIGVLWVVLQLLYFVLFALHFPAQPHDR